MFQVIQKSKQDAKSVDTDSQDDPELQLALMLSKETDQVNPVRNITKPGNGGIQGIDKSTVDINDVHNNVLGESQEELDEQMRIAIERSKLDSRHNSMIDNKTGDGPHRRINSDVHVPDVSPDISVHDSIGMSTLPEDEDEQLSLAISMSKVIKTPENSNQEVLDIQMQEAIELSKSISTPKQSNQELLDIQMQEVIKLSKSINTPKKSNEEVLDIQMQEAIELSKSISTPKKSNEVQMQEAIKLSKSINTPEKSNREMLDSQMQVAFELSKSINTPEKSNEEVLDVQMQEAIELSKSLSTPKESDQELLDIQMQEVIERSKLDHTPQKVVDADYQLKVAIERSKIENSPKILDSELEQKILKVAIAKSIAEHSPVSSPRKRKHNLIDDCNVSRKILRTPEKKCFGGRDTFEAATTDNEGVINLCDSQNSIIQGIEMTGSNEEVIQIDSQSQDINTDEELEAQENIKHVKSWDMTNDTLCLTGENINKEPMNSASNVDSDAYDSIEGDEEDLIPPSPCKDSLNSSQISVGFNSFTAKSNASSVLSSEIMRCSGDSKNIILNSSLQLQEPNRKLCDSLTSTCEGTEDFCVAQKSSVLSQVSTKVTSPQKSSELSQESSKVTNSQTSPELSDVCTTVANLPESNNSDSSKLKSSLLRLVDENASDDESFSESDSEDDNGVDHNKSHDDSTGSVADIFEGDKTDDRIINVPSKDTNSNEVPKLSETVPKLSSSLVNEATEQCAQARYSKYTGETNMQSDSKMAKSESNDRSVSETGVNTIASDLQSFIKVEPADEDIITSPPLNPHETAKKKTAENSKLISDVIVKSESKEQNESLVYSQRDSSEYCGYDSDMDEVNFNPDLDDSDADPSFKPGKASSTESSISDDDDDDDNMDELISKIDPDYLPSITRPKKRRTSQQKDTTGRKKTSDSSDSKSKKRRHANNDIVVKVEKSESPVIDTGMDAMLAQMLQRGLNKEAESLASVNSRGSNSAHIAGRMQGHSLSPSDAVETDEELARRLDAELNNENSSSGYEHHKARDSAGVLPRGSASDSVCQTKSEAEPRGNKHPELLGVNDIMGTDNLVKELQRRELEKIQRMQKFLEVDKKLAEKLQENFTENGKLAFQFNLIS